MSNYVANCLIIPIQLIALEINRSTLVIPALCGHLERDSIALTSPRVSTPRTAGMVREKCSRNSASEKTETA